MQTKMRARRACSSPAACSVLVASAAALFFLIASSTVMAQSDPQGLYALSALNIDGAETSLGEHHGKVSLVVNLASQ